MHMPRSRIEIERLGLCGRARIGVLGGAVAAACLLANTAVASAAPSFTWAGAGSPGTTTWSTPANWAGGQAPASSSSIDTLTFPRLTSPACTATPPTAACNSSLNDLTALSIGALNIDARAYAISGNPATLGAGGLTVSQATTGATNPSTLTMALALGADQTWNVSGPAGSAPGQTLFGLFAPVTGAHALAIDVANGAVLSLNGTSAEVGPVTITGANASATSPDINGGVGLFTASGQTSALDDAGGQPVMVSHAALTASGAIGALTTSGALIRVGQGGLPRTLRTSAATFDAASETNFPIYSSGTNAGADYGQLSSTGAVSLAGKPTVSSFDATCASLPNGRVYTLVSTTGALTGAYTGVPDGARIAIAPYSGCLATGQQMRIDYHETGVTQTVTGTVVTADTTPPTVQVLSPTAGQHYAVGASAQTAFTCADETGGSGVRSCDGPATLDTTTAGAHRFTVTATDYAGNVFAANVAYVVDAPDTGPPVITIVTPASGQHFATGASVASVFSCADEVGGSGVASCAGSATVDTATAGSHTFTVTASDHAGHSIAVTNTYIVDPPAGNHGVEAATVGSDAASSLTGASLASTSAYAATTTGVIRPLVHCSELKPCRGTLTLTVPRKAGSAVTTTIATSRYSLVAGRSARIVLKLNAAGLRLLKAARAPLRATLTIKPSEKGAKIVKRSIKLSIKKT